MLIDFFFIFILLFSIYNGYYKGFANMLLSFVLFIVAVAISFFAFSYASDIFMETKYGKELCKNISATVEYELKEAENKSIENIPYLSSLYKTNDGDNILEFSKFSDSITQKAIKSVVSLPIIIMIFLLMKFGFKIVRSVVKKTVSLPVISTADALLGSVCGLFMGLAILAVSYSILSFLQFVPQFYKLKFQFDTSAFVLLINDFIF